MRLPALAKTTPAESYGSSTQSRLFKNPTWIPKYRSSISNSAWGDALTATHTTAAPATRTEMEQSSLFSDRLSEILFSTITYMPAKMACFVILDVNLEMLVSESIGRSDNRLETNPIKSGHFKQFNHYIYSTLHCANYVVWKTITKVQFRHLRAFVRLRCPFVPT